VNKFPPSPSVPEGRIEFFRKFAEIFAAQGDTGGKRKKSLMRKVLIIFIKNLLVVKLTLINFSLQVHCKVQAV
jgi:hypothetical protein